MKQIVSELCDAGLQAAIQKYEFKIQSTSVLVLIVDTEDSHTDPGKLKAVSDWPSGLL